MDIQQGTFDLSLRSSVFFFFFFFFSLLREAKRAALEMVSSGDDFLPSGEGRRGLKSILSDFVFS